MKPKRSTVALLSWATLAAASAAAAPAGSPPSRQDIGTIPYTATVDCGAFGLGFELTVQGAETLSVETFYDAHGVAARVVVHDSFRETDTNSSTGETLPFAGNQVDTYDLGAGTRTVVGREFLMTAPGAGVVIHDSGRVVFAAPGDVSFSAGPHEVLYGDVDALACSALATTPRKDPK